MPIRREDFEMYIHPTTKSVKGSRSMIKMPLLRYLIIQDHQTYQVKQERFYNNAIEHKLLGFEV